MTHFLQCSGWPCGFVSQPVWEKLGLVYRIISSPLEVVQKDFKQAVKSFLLTSNKSFKVARSRYSGINRDNYNVANIFFFVFVSVEKICAPFVFSSLIIISLRIWQNEVTSCNSWDQYKNPSLKAETVGVENIHCKVFSAVDE